MLDKVTHFQKDRIERRGITSLAALDLAALLRILDKNWHHISNKLNIPVEDHHLVQEMQKIRNRWAHPDSRGMLIDDIYRDLDTLQRFLIILQADKDYVQEVRSKKSLLLARKAEQLQKEKDEQRKIEIERNLPKAWDELVSSSNIQLMDMLNVILERLCGIRADYEKIDAFLRTRTISIVKGISAEKQVLEEARLNDVKPPPKPTKQKTLRVRQKKTRAFPPDGTLCRFLYKGKEFRAKVEMGEIVVDGYGQYSSFSAASVGVTKTSRNGWRDWELKLPNSVVWVLADTWRRKIGQVEKSGV